ncbi:hypothetical protein GBA52_007578 [Prunus armeniaca]|nr:hypothetical protein GBA52_007578 [Prunus armeniaca]
MHSTALVERRSNLTSRRGNPMTGWLRMRMAIRMWGKLTIEIQQELLDRELEVINKAYSCGVVHLILEVWQLRKKLVWLKEL